MSLGVVCWWGASGWWWWCDSELVAAEGGLGSFNSVVFVSLRWGFALGGYVGFR